MPLFFLRRLLSFVLTLLATSVVVFVVLELLPGNAAQVILGGTATPESIAAMEEKLGLNQPAATRYLNWMGGLLQGQTGLSISYDTPTAQLMTERMQVTLPLAVMAMGLTVALALDYARRPVLPIGDVVFTAALASVLLTEFAAARFVRAALLPIVEPLRDLAHRLPWLDAEREQDAVAGETGEFLAPVADGGSSLHAPPARDVEPPSGAPR